jgi:hypothetical protein
MDELVLLWGLRCCKAISVRDAILQLRLILVFYLLLFVFINQTGEECVSTHGLGLLLFWREHACFRWFVVGQVVVVLSILDSHGRLGWWVHLLLVCLILRPAVDTPGHLPFVEGTLVLPGDVHTMLVRELLLLLLSRVVQAVLIREVVLLLLLSRAVLGLVVLLLLVADLA